MIHTTVQEAWLQDWALDPIMSFCWCRGSLILGAFTPARSRFPQLGVPFADEARSPRDHVQPGLRVPALGPGSATCTARTKNSLHLTEFLVPSGVGIHIPSCVWDATRTKSPISCETWLQCPSHRSMWSILRRGDCSIWDLPATI